MLAVAGAIARYEKVMACTVLVNIPVLDESFSRVEDSLRKSFKSYEAPQGYEPSVFKIAGVICFWLRKLKPFFVLEKPEEHRFLNETVAFQVGYSLVFRYSQQNRLHTPKITANFLHDITTSLRYNAHSPNSTAFLFEGLSL